MPVMYVCISYSNKADVVNCDTLNHMRYWSTVSDSWLQEQFGWMDVQLAIVRDDDDLVHFVSSCGPCLLVWMLLWYAAVATIVLLHAFVRAFVIPSISYCPGSCEHEGILWCGVSIGHPIKTSLVQNLSPPLVYWVLVVVSGRFKSTQQQTTNNKHTNNNQPTKQTTNQPTKQTITNNNKQ